MTTMLKELQRATNKLKDRAEMIWGNYDDSPITDLALEVSRFASVLEKCLIDIETSWRESDDGGAAGAAAGKAAEEAERFKERNT